MKPATALRRSPLVRILAAGALLALCAGPAASRPRKPAPPVSTMPPLTPAVIDDDLTIGGEEIAARKVRSRLTVEVGVNGSGPYRFVVDSGADTSVVSTRLARALQMPLGEPVMLNGITESRTVDRVKVRSLQLGPTVTEDLQLPRLDESDIGAVGMIGLDALVEQRLMLDFEKRKISVDDGRRPAPRYDGEIVVTARLKRGQLILTQVKANGLALNAVVDTGSEITIGNRALRDRVVKRGRTPLQKVEVIGVTGAKATMEVAVIDKLKLGSVVLTNVPIAFADIPPFAVFGLDQQPALLLGTDLMENFRKVSLDFHNRKVRFQLRKCGSQDVVIRLDSSFATRLSTEPGNSAVCSN